MKEILLLLSLMDSETQWLTRNIFFEVRHNTYTFEQRANVGQVVLNRLNDGFWGDSIEKVLTYKTHHESGKKTCDFSWYCDGKSDKLKSYMYNQKNQLYVLEYKSAVNSFLAAKYVMRGEHEGKVQGAKFYHAKTLKPVPSFFKKLQLVHDDGVHLFYK